MFWENNNAQKKLQVEKSMKRLLSIIGFAASLSLERAEFGWGGLGWAGLSRDGMERSVVGWGMVRLDGVAWEVVERCGA